MSEYRFLKKFKKKGKKKLLPPKRNERGGGGKVRAYGTCPLKRVFFIDALLISNGHTQSCSVKNAIEVSSIYLKKDIVKGANATFNTKHNNSTSHVENAGGSFSIKEEKDGSPPQVPSVPGG